MVIKHVLGVGELHPGLYGKTSAYYGTVEQQGRLTLHMHMMLWIKGAMSPQMIRDRLMSKDSEFEEAMKKYLEAAHAGEFMTGTMDDVRKKCTLRTEDAAHKDSLDTNSMSDLDSTEKKTQKIPKYEDPTQTLPLPPPLHCNCILDDDTGDDDAGTPNC